MNHDYYKIIRYTLSAKYNTEIPVVRVVTDLFLLLLSYITNTYLL